MHIPLWIISQDLDNVEKMSRLAGSTQAAELIDIQNWTTLFYTPMVVYWNSESGTQKSYGMPGPLVARLPGDPWVPPDFVSLGGFPLVSRHFRNAVGDMPGTVEYVPVTLLDSSASVVAQDYQFLNVIAVQPAFDLNRSYGGKRNMARIGGVTYGPKRLINGYHLLPGFVAATEVFHERELPGILLTTDAVAERVMKAGCTGVEFMDPATYYVLNGVTRFRTADGIGEVVLG